MWDHRCLSTSKVAVAAGALNCSEAVVLFVFDDSSSLMWCLVRQPFFFIFLYL